MPTTASLWASCTPSHRVGREQVLRATGRTRISHACACGLRYEVAELLVAAARVSRDVGAPAAAVQRMGSCASMKMPGSWVSCT